MTTVYSTTPPPLPSVTKHLRVSTMTPSMADFTREPAADTGVDVSLRRLDENGKVVSILGIGAPFLRFAPDELQAPFIRKEKPGAAAGKTSHTPKTRLYVTVDLLDPSPFFGARIFAGMNILRIIGGAHGYTYVDAVIVLLCAMARQSGAVAHIVKSLFPAGRLTNYFKFVCSYATLVDYQQQVTKVSAIALALSVGRLPGVDPRPYYIGDSVPLYIRVDPDIAPFECTHEALRKEILSVVGIVGVGYFFCRNPQERKRGPLVIDLADRVMSLLPRGRASYAGRVRAILDTGMPPGKMKELVEKAGIQTKRRDKQQDPVLDIIMDMLYRRSDDLTRAEQELLFSPDQHIFGFEFLS